MSADPYEPDATDRGPQIGRLAFRREGGNVNAYWAQASTMDGAIFMGSITVAICDGQPDKWVRFKDLMRDSFGEVVFGTVGVRPIWGGEETAPEHERAGRA